MGWGRLKESTKFNGPYSSSGCNVKDIVYSSGKIFDGCIVELPPKGQEKEVMLKIYFLSVE